MRPPGPGGGRAGEKAEAAPSCSQVGLKRGPWTAEEDELLAKCIKREGEGRWRALPKKAGLLRCGKSCRLRWMNYLRPSVKRGHITPDEEDLILRLHRLLGNRWSLIAGRIPGRTDNEIKNYWNTHLSKKLISQGIDPKTHKPLNPNPTINATQLAANTSHSEKHADDETDLGNSSERISNEDAGEEMMINGPDEAFLSFLNSLINDDMFSNQHHEDQQEQNQPTTCLI